MNREIYGFCGNFEPVSLLIRLQAVPFWIVERLREIAEREKTGANERRGAWERREKGESLFSFISPRSSLAAL